MRAAAHGRNALSDFQRLSISKQALVGVVQTCTRPIRAAGQLTALNPFPTGCNRRFASTNVEAVAESKDGPLYPVSGKQQRNVAVIAHVDHGKTSLVDRLLRFSDFASPEKSLVQGSMDSNDLEKERGITILAKCTSLEHKDVLYNIVDTPGHADFGGEVERMCVCPAVIDIHPPHAVDNLRYNP